MKILLTGNEGFIGKNLETELTSQGHDVIGFEKDCTISDIVEEMHSNPVVVHQGAITDTLYPDNIEMMVNNYEFSKRLFDEAFSRNIKVVYASSAACYGISDEGTPANIYGWSKYCAEQYGLALYKPQTILSPFSNVNSKAQFIALRYYNVFGMGEEHKGRMSSIAYQAMVKGSMTLFPGQPRRDFVYVKDVVRANLHAITNNYIKTGYYDVGSGVASTFEDVCDNLEVPYTHTSEDNIPEGYQFFTKSSEEKWLPGWEPKYDLKTALKEYKESYTEAIFPQKIL